jgi:hypothetical protein
MKKVMRGDFVLSAGPNLNPIEVEFADGVRIVPAHILRIVKREDFENPEYVAALKQLTWAEFLSPFENEVNRTSLESRFGAERMLQVNKRRARGW